MERAREKDKDKEREQAAARQKQTIPKLVIGKRKKSVLTKVEDDELLALATPAKKERSHTSSPAPSAPGPSTAVVQAPEKPSVRRSPPARPSPPVRNGVSKADKSTKGKTSAPAAVPKISIKGKEKEREGGTPAPQPAPKAKKSSPPQTERTPINEKKCRDALKTLTKLPQAGIFLLPVDVVRDGCPT